MSNITNAADVRELSIEEVEMVNGAVGTTCVRGAQWLGKVIRDASHLKA